MYFPTHQYHRYLTQSRVENCSHELIALIHWITYTLHVQIVFSAWNGVSGN